MTQVPVRAETVLAAAELMGCGIWYRDIISATSWWSAGMYGLLGLDDTVVPSLDALLECMHPQDRRGLQEDIALTLLRGKAHDMVFRLLRPSGSMSWVHSRANVISPTQGQPTRLVGVLRDISREREQALARESRHRRLVSLVESDWDLFWAIDPGGRVLGAAREMVEDPAAVGDFEVDPLVALEIAGAVAAYLPQAVAPLAEGRTPPGFRVELEGRASDGSPFEMEFKVVPVPQGDRPLAWLLGVSRDLRDGRARLSDLREQAWNDSLTGLRNRRYAEQALTTALHRHRSEGVPMCLLLLDLDHFKRVNDAHGHASGDRLLKQVSRSIEGAVREGDLVARWGGEEFVVLIADCTEPTGHRVGERIRALVAEAHLRELVGARVTASIGVTRATAADDAESWLERADRALYTAKAAGRDCVRTSHPA